MFTNSRQKILWVLGLFLCFGGIAWLIWANNPTHQTMMPVERVEVLTSGGVASMDSPPFVYSHGWQVSASGADPGEPADPWHEPAGIVEFDYAGTELALQIDPGDYWGYLYVTVDGEPASELPVIHGNMNSQDQPAGYKPLYEPDSHSPRWLRIHHSMVDAEHHARIEVWRSWGQTPLHAVAIDALPPETGPSWPGVLMLVGAGWLLVAAVMNGTISRKDAQATQTNSEYTLIDDLSDSVSDVAPSPIFLGLWITTLALIAAAMIVDLWWLALAGLALLGLISLPRPAIWLATLLFGLPFYFSFPIPLLPFRSFNLIEVGIYGGLAVWAASMLLTFSKRWRVGRSAPDTGGGHWVSLALAAVISWALVATAAASLTHVALYEWRTVFLAAGAFALLLSGVLATARFPMADRRLLLYAWLAGATTVAAIGCWQFASNSMLIEAEGVTRIRAFYGSPNNLALYLERTLAVTLSLSLFPRERRSQIVWLVAAAVQGLALLLTFSKGAIFLGVPALLVTLWLGGFWLLRQRSQSTRPLWLLAGLTMLGLLLLTPFLGTERFTRLVDLSQGTGFLRLQLWRSSWQMALDHLPFGVGPDNFLYAYRSGYILPEAWQEPNLNHPHNWLLDWWTRLGLPGLLLGLAFWGAGIAVLWQRLRHGHDEIQVWALGFLAATAAILAHGFIDLSYALPDLMIVWVLIFFLIGEQGNST